MLLPDTEARQKEMREIHCVRVMIRLRDADEEEEEEGQRQQRH